MNKFKAPFRAPTPKNTSEKVPKPCQSSTSKSSTKPANENSNPTPASAQDSKKKVSTSGGQPGTAFPSHKVPPKVSTGEPIKARSTIGKKKTSTSGGRSDIPTPKNPAQESADESSKDQNSSNQKDPKPTKSLTDQEYDKIFAKVVNPSPNVTKPNPKSEDSSAKTKKFGWHEVTESDFDDSDSEDSKPTKSLKDQDYERIFAKVVNPSPNVTKSNLKSEDSSAKTKKFGWHEVTESDFEDSDSESADAPAFKGYPQKTADTEILPSGKKILKNPQASESDQRKSSQSEIEIDATGTDITDDTSKGFEEEPPQEHLQAKVSEPGSSRSSSESVDAPAFKGFPQKAAGTEVLPSGKKISKNPQASESDQRKSSLSEIEIDFTATETTDETSKGLEKEPTHSEDLQSNGPQPVPSRLSSESADAAVFRGFPKTQTVSKNTKNTLSRRLQFDRSFSSSEDLTVSTSKNARTPANVRFRAEKRTLERLDYDETPVTRFPYKQSKSLKDEDKENSQEKSAFQTGSFHSARSNSSRKSPFSDISNVSSNVQASSTSLPVAPRKPSTDTHTSQLPEPSEVSTGASTFSSQPLSQASVYSVPASQMTPQEKLRWLLPRRMVGTWVQCNRCEKWRYIKNVHDPTVFPERWSCNLSTDPEKNTCEASEERWSLKDQLLMIYNSYAPGSIVWAHVEGYPWWPAIVDDDPDYLQYFWMDDGASEIPTQYHVVFFQAAPCRAWVTTKNIRPYRSTPGEHLTSSQNPVWASSLRSAQKKADRAMAMDTKDRVLEFGVLARFRGKIGGLKSASVNPAAPDDEEHSDDD